MLLGADDIYKAGGGGTTLLALVFLPDVLKLLHCKLIFFLVGVWGSSPTFMYLGSLRQHNLVQMPIKNSIQIQLKYILHLRITILDL